MNTGAPDTKRRLSKIPRPSGEAGRGFSGKKGGFSLVEAMEIEKDTCNNARVSLLINFGCNLDPLMQLLFKASIRGILTFHYPHSELRVLTFHKMEDRTRGVIRTQVGRPLNLFPTTNNSLRPRS